MHFGILNIIILFHFGKLFTIYIEMISHFVKMWVYFR